MIAIRTSLESLFVRIAQRSAEKATKTNAKGELVDESGKPVLDKSGNPVKAIINEKGEIVDESGKPVLDESGEPMLAPVDEKGQPVSLGTKDGRSALYQEGRAPLPEPVIKVGNLLQCGNAAHTKFRKRSAQMGKRFYLAKAENHSLTIVVGKFLSMKMEESSSRATTESQFLKSKVPVLKVSLSIFNRVRLIFQRGQKGGEDSKNRG